MLHRLAPGKDSEDAQGGQEENFVWRACAGGKAAGTPALQNPGGDLTATQAPSPPSTSITTR